MTTAQSIAKTLGIILFPAYDWAISPTHPEREERLLYTHDQLREEGIFDLPGITEFKPRTATVEEIARAHFCPPGLEQTVAQPHFISAGSAITAADLVMKGTKQTAFALTRPPGHHAMRVVQGSRGFCTINIEAVMVEHIRQTYGIKRIAIVDTDCHHGDGTQDIYWHDPNVLFISIHQDGRTLYPGSGFPNEVGGPTALGSTVNIPLPPRTGDEGYLYVMEHLVRPLLDKWEPDLVINSAGQDNHFSDPITDMNITAQGYGNLVSLLQPDIAVLEGGYAIQGALPYVNLAVLLALAGMDYSHVVEPALSRYDTSTDARTMEYIHKLTDTMLEVLHAPGRLSSDEYSLKNGWWTRQRNIYYDTDNISEQQEDRVLACEDCSGLVERATKTTYTKNSLCLHIPHGACQQCIAKGYELFDTALASHKPVELYDAVADVYKQRP